MDSVTPGHTALIIFVRNPVLGKVKTRLANVIGDEKALAIYKMLLNHTHQIALPLNCRKFVYYADEVTDYDLWNQPGFTKRQQLGQDLGERMSNAFRDLFEQGFKKVLIIGSDCYQLQTDLLQESIHLLATHDMVLGPTFDGGYYLLGMTSFIPGLFADKQWSTNTVAEQTIKDAGKLKLSYTLLEHLHDVDEVADLELNHIEI